jgi:hypothetical protein
MYQLFMVGAKLLGIYQIIEGLIQAAMLTTPRGAAYAPQLVPSCFLNLMIGTALAFGTGFIAKAVRIREEFGGEAPSISYRSALEVGIVLISLLEILSVLPRVAVRWMEYSQLIAQTRSPAELLNKETIGLLAAIALLFFAHRIAAFLERVNRPPSAPESI